MLSPVVQKLIGTAAMAVCTLAVTAIIGGVVLYGDVRAIHERLDGQDARVSVLQGDVTHLSRRITAHQIDHE